MVLGIAVRSNRRNAAAQLDSNVLLRVDLHVCWGPRTLLSASPVPPVKEKVWRLRSGGQGCPRSCKILSLCTIANKSARSPSIACYEIRAGGVLQIIPIPIGSNNFERIFNAKR